ncbi:hypothetical protein [Acinetobacter towneri]|uniref:Polysaccharide biosynthesis protein n=1 Tax=Acinetobacter towneri TaxID=202956 RepID=A0AB35M2I3_9GAMM|nr:hypothetical protein [Acinetobacter towneri]MDM1719800.1 hypothetical protein [Acinetobacter towneri]MDM1731881.1 hypothetical protein [Acinetobacter towneri]MDM1734557.1 hypothetical protein [Acinetobacter towneri]MDM1739879.1 hypothetical protein [Acinetobacter towneri]MDM1742545.1 hypothetical protein [Acinetobacter towneri]
MSKNTTILRNASYLVFRTLLVSLIGLFTVREVLRLLGVEEYGLFNLVFGIAALFAFINGAMVSSTQRYLSYYIGKKNNKLFEDAWSSSLFLHLLIAVTVSVVLLSIRDLMLNRVLSIDLNYMKSANFIFYFAIISIFISIFQAPFNALILAKEKMSFYAGLSLYDAISKLGIVFCLYFMQESLLEKYTILYVSSSLVVFVIYILYCYKKFDKKIQLKVSNVPLLKEMFFYSSWNISGNFAAISKIQGINILLNIFFGVIVNSAYAITNTVIGVVSGLINSITTAINPQIYKSYAEEDYKRNSLLINIGSKFSFFFCLLIVLPILFNTQYLLELWLHEIPDYLIDFVQLALVIMLIDCLSGTLMTGIQATGKIKIYQIVVSISVFMNLPLSYLTLQFIPKPSVIYWIALLMAFVSLGLRLYFLKRLAKFSIIVYMNSVLVKIALVLFFSVFFSWFLKELFEIDDQMISFLLSSIIIVLIVVANIVLFGLSTIERQFIQNKIKGYLK